MNPPFFKKFTNYIKKYKSIANKIIFIIPCIEGNINIKLFGCKQYSLLKIFDLKYNEYKILERYTKNIKSNFYIHVPLTSYFNNYYKTGFYKNEYIDNRNNKIYYNYYTFNFECENDLNIFKERLLKKSWLKTKGLKTPNYQDILKGLNYIKSYREI